MFDGESRDGEESRDVDAATEQVNERDDDNDDDDDDDNLIVVLGDDNGVDVAETGI